MLVSRTVALADRPFQSRSNESSTCKHFPPNDTEDSNGVTLTLLPTIRANFDHENTSFNDSRVKRSNWSLTMFPNPLM